MAKTKLPQRPGHYLWFVLDMSYLEVGSVHVLKDPANHLDYLRSKLEEMGPNGVSFHLYQNDAGEWLTMYHDAHDHLPARDESGFPCVDDYRRYDFWTLVGGTPPTPEEPDEETMRFDEFLAELGGEG
jgi:hypothetical protein